MSLEQHDKPLEICVVEDEPDLREGIVESLQMAGFKVRGFAESRTFYAALLHTPCDIAVLDVGLPNEDGFSICERLHSLGGIGIIILTARSLNEDRVYGLQHGADAYLVKPTDLHVLEATIVSLARRLKKDRPLPGVTPAAATTTWELSADGWTLFDPAGQPLPLAAQERIFLRCLMERRGTVTSREVVIAALGENPEEYDLHRLTALVNRLRKKAQDLGLSLPLRAIRGTGYVFAGE